MRTRIELLCDHREAIPRLAHWYVSEWAPYYGDCGPGDALVDLEARCNRKTLPIGFVALADNDIIATAAIGLDVATGLTPSIIGLLVEASHRGRGVGRALIQSCKDFARTHGYSQLHFSTDVLGNMLEKTGWQKTGKAIFLNDEQGSVYVLRL